MAKKQSTALVNYDEEFARAAEEAAASEANTGGGQFFSTRGGQLKLNDSPLPNNEMAVVIVDSLLVNALYEGDYDPENLRSPVCYAFGRSDETIAPHAEADKKQSESCAECEHNKFGSAEKGRGKACKNGRRLALISAGTIDKSGEFVAHEEQEHFDKAQVAYLNLPPTSINGFGAYVKQIVGALKRPPHGVFTRISLVPDPKTQFKITFESLGPVPDDLVPLVIKKNKETRAVIEFPFQRASEREEAQPPPKRAAAAARRRF